MLKDYKILVSLSNWKHTYLAEYLFVSIWKVIDRINLSEKNLKRKQKKSRNRKKHCINNGNVREKWAKRTQSISIS